MGYYVLHSTAVKPPVVANNIIHINTAPTIVENTVLLHINVSTIKSEYLLIRSILCGCTFTINISSKLHSIYSKKKSVRRLRMIRSQQPLTPQLEPFAHRRVGPSPKTVAWGRPPPMAPPPDLTRIKIPWGWGCHGGKTWTNPKNMDLMYIYKYKYLYIMYVYIYIYDYIIVYSYTNTWGYLDTCLRIHVK